ncbi:hypothetical protein VTK26DRAFT_696 [Humicola hyalothermophila]
MTNSKPGTPHQVKFVGHDAVGLPVKRKQVHQACLPCRKRKKRCHHHAGPRDDKGPAEKRRGDGGRSVTVASVPPGPDQDTSDAAAQLLSFFHHSANKNPDGGIHRTVEQQQQQQQQQQQHVEPARPFLGDTNPEGILFEATMAPPNKPAKKSVEDRSTDVDGPQIGVFFSASPESPRSSRCSPVQGPTESISDSFGVSNQAAGPFFSVPREDGSRLVVPLQDTAHFTKLARTILNRTLASKVIPSDTAWRQMRDLYLAKIHPIFPIFEKSTLIELPKEAELRELIQASVCLAAATDPDARDLLTFHTTPEQTAPGQPSMSRIVVPFDTYSREVANFILRRLRELEKKQQLPLALRIRVMAITCLYWQPAHLSDRFEPHTLFAKVVSLAHTHGIHLDLHSKPFVGHSLDAEGSGSRLFKCLYALDRLLSAFAGRPIMFHNVDMIRIPGPDKQDPPSFRLFMSLILLLDQVIEMYRPNPTVSYIDVPVFERLAIDAEAQGEPEGILATLEVLYHAICVLSVRMPRDRFRIAPECDEAPGPRIQHLPPSGVNARRSHSADRIVDVIQQYKISPMPFVPYALTLSLSVAYRKWRFSQLPMFRTRGGADFKKVLPILQQMGATWTSARLNGQLGQAVMEKLDQSEIPKEKRPNIDAKQVDPKLMPEEGDCQATRTTTPFNAPFTLGIPARSESINTNRHLEQPPHAIAPGLAQRQQQPSSPLTWTAPLTSVSPDATGATITSGSTYHKSAGINRQKKHTEECAEQPRDQTQATSPVPPAPLPLPGDLAYPSSSSASGAAPPGVGLNNNEDIPPPPSAGGEDEAFGGINGTSFEGNFLDDDALMFQSWDPRFAQSVDDSFSSNLDLGIPFAWPEYCGGYYLG